MPNAHSIQIGSCYDFVRKGNKFSGCEVAVLSQRIGGFTVAKSTHVCAALLAPQNSKKRKLKTWVAKESELI